MSVNVTTPRRPKVDPDKWLVVYEFTNKSQTGNKTPHLSTPTAHDGQAGALTVAQNAKTLHGTKHVKVKKAYVYPPVGNSTPVRTVTF